MNEITKKLMCVQMRSGVEIYIEADRAEALQQALAQITQSKFIRFDDQTFNTADIVGVFSAQTMGDLTRRKNGGWQCDHASWHGKGEKCECTSRAVTERIREREEAIRRCGKCQNGFVMNTNNTAERCSCQKALDA